MIDFNYLLDGIRGLANAHSAGTMAGHLGAAVAAGYFISEDQPNLPDEVFRGVEGELDRIKAGEEAIWFNAKKVGMTPTDLFRELPGERTTPASTDAIATALGTHAGQLRQSGHDVIFASIAIRALKDHKEFATEEAIDGVVKLIRAFAKQSEGRGFYGKANGWKSGQDVELEPDGQFPVPSSIEEAVRITLNEVVATASMHRQGFGGLWHIINHTAGIVELDRYGYTDLALKTLPGHHRHIRLWRTLPDVADELGPTTKSQLKPSDPDYWNGMLKRDQARLTHRIKTIYGFHTICTAIDDPQLVAKADDAFLFLMD